MIIWGPLLQQNITRTQSPYLPGLVVQIREDVLKMPGAGPGAQWALPRAGGCSLLPVNLAVCSVCLMCMSGLLAGCLPHWGEHLHAGVSVFSLPQFLPGSSDVNERNQLWRIIGRPRGPHRMAGESETQAWHGQASPPLGCHTADPAQM